jgi:DNA-binding HxlR family transcriptional regulator
MSIKLTSTAEKLALQRQVRDGVNSVIDLFHKRWTMRILWELRDGPVTFRELQAACSMVSSSVLNVRLSELREAQLVEHSSGEGYQLSGWGKELLLATQPLTAWASRWSKRSLED